MVDQSLLSLQNGSDIRGVASDGIIGQSVTLTPDKVSRLCAGFVEWLRSRKSADEKTSTKMRIAIGMDARLTGPILAQAAQDSIRAAGADVLFCGLASTPSMLYSTKKVQGDGEECIGADGAVMLTGSHMTFNMNGMKFFTLGN